MNIVSSVALMVLSEFPVALSHLFVWLKGILFRDWFLICGKFVNLFHTRLGFIPQIEIGETVTTTMKCETKCEMTFIHIYNVLLSYSTFHSRFLTKLVSVNI